MGATGLRDLLRHPQERFEQTRVGEIAISVLVALILIVAVAWSMPDSAIRRSAVPVVEPLAVTAGLDQAWYMFAPDPYRRLEVVEVRVETVDGEERVWSFPLGGVLGQFTWYRWHKVKEQSVRRPEIRADVTRWAARRLLDPSDYPAQVSMVLRATDFVPPGVQEEPAPPTTEVLYAETLAGPP